MTKTETTLVVAGLDSDQKARAAKFRVSDEKAAHKIAAVNRFKVGHARTEEAIELVEHLVDGKIFSSGKGLVPLVNAETYEKLLNLLDFEDQKTDVATVKATSTPTSPNPFAAIAVGSTVLCPDGKGKDKSWWECTVVAVAKDSLTVKWSHYPTLKAFKTQRAQVALLPSKN